MTEPEQPPAGSREIISRVGRLRLLSIANVTTRPPLVRPFDVKIPTASTPMSGHVPIAVVRAARMPRARHRECRSAWKETAMPVMVVEAPLNEERTVAVLAETRKLVPSKRIRT